MWLRVCRGCRSVINDRIFLDHAESFKNYYYFISCIWVFCLYACIYVPHTEAWCPSLKKASNPLDLKLSTVVSHHVGAGNWMKIPEKQVLFTADHLSSPSTFIFFFKYTVAIFRYTQRGLQILLPMVVSHQVVHGIWTWDLRKSSSNHS